MDKVIERLRKDRDDLRTELQALRAELQAWQTQGMRAVGNLYNDKYKVRSR